MIPIGSFSFERSNMITVIMTTATKSLLSPSPDQELSIYELTMGMISLFISQKRLRETKGLPEVTMTPSARQDIN